MKQVADLLVADGVVAEGEGAAFLHFARSAQEAAEAARAKELPTLIRLTPIAARSATLSRTPGSPMMTLTGRSTARDHAP